MDNLLLQPLQQEDVDDAPVSESLSEIELADLVTTKFVEQTGNLANPTEDIELVRSVGSPIQFLSPIHHSRLNEGVILEEYECLRRPVEETTGLDPAVLLLNRIQHALEDELQQVSSWNVFEKSKKWKKTSRTTELALINSTISLVDARPAHLHFFCRRLTENDIAEIVLKSLTTVPLPEKFRSLYRINIKTEMPLKQFLDQLDRLYKKTPCMTVIEGKITAIQKTPEGLTQKFFTTDITKFAEMEHVLWNTAFCRMSVTAKFVFGRKDADHILLLVEYQNAMDSHGKRAKTIMIEQQVKPLPNVHSRRRVTFGTPELVQVHEFELDENAPFHPLGLSGKFQDLIQHLEKAPPPSGDAPKNCSFKNVTIR